ncbi:hypothetical protein [Halalkalicoccus jeotgali]|uniref:Uncharacterized protein n=1 Tax=Halalkalicoccus jeotgali (strain DSM 18796 / CECT 7217 / JCM 14584 / KCTC 4019 / B3) TaxID=795797 RepID=D8J6Y2_HALJB|nr:hypothetical protein [Halalkalicoccus jeotgali]ADJ15935.1 hypothetical protein HacjB3_12770 [Halalkalicoccus jeotgali B3]ELY38031.1 hypothetical protein C497_07974 [Halalkalicoccus jeotgali B3]
MVPLRTAPLGLLARRPIAAAVFTVEAVYFERESIAQGVREAERQL